MNISLLLCMNMLPYLFFSDIKCALLINYLFPSYVANEFIY